MFGDLAMVNLWRTSKGLWRIYEGKYRETGNVKYSWDLDGGRIVNRGYARVKRQRFVRMG